jgi:hypothetical protein
MTKGIRRFTRQELYDLVWSEPMSQLAKRFGVSDVGLSKACRRAAIPVPERGFWAKRQAGKPTVQQALPPRGPGMHDEVEVGGGTSWSYSTSEEELVGGEGAAPPVFSEDTDDLAARVRKMVGKVTVPKTLAKPHRLIARLVEDDEHRRETQQNSPHAWSWDNPVFDSPLERRRLRILNATFLALSRCGMKPAVRGREARELSAQIGLSYVSFTLDRVTKRRQPAGADFAKDKSRERLRFQIVTRPGATDVRRSWEDSDGTKLEDQLDDIVVQLIIAGELQYRELVQSRYQWRLERKAELEEEERRRKEEEDRLKRERQVKAQRERLERLFNEASALRKAGEIRAYVEAVWEASALARSPLPQERLQNWIAWALGEADRIDPIRSGRFIADVKDGQDS